jgi:AraC-like DNA-binding protein
MIALNTIILFGALQGLIASAIIFLQKGGKRSSKFLSAIIFILSLACLNIFLMLSGLADRYQVIETLGFFVPLTVAMPLGPLVYFYLRSIDDPAVRIDKRHFIPIVFDLLPYAFGAAYVLSRLFGAEVRELIAYMDIAHTYVDIPRWLSLSIYLAIAARTFGRNQVTPHRGYLRVFLSVFIGFQVLWLIHLVPYILPSTRNTLMTLVNWYPVYIPLAFLLYFVSFYGLLFQRELKVRSKSNATIPGDTLKRIAEAMSRDYLFTNPDLSVDDVARHLNVPQKQVSAAINQQLGKSFNEFVNGYRIEEVKKRMCNTSYAHLTLTGLAFECGFNSQATFQRVFKQFTNQTPGQFKRSLRQAIV